MTSREFFIATLKDEIPRFERVIRSLPDEKISWRPHERSRSAWEIIMAMVMESSTFPVFLKTGEVDYAQLPAMEPKAINDAWIRLKENFDETLRIASAMTEAEWDLKSKELTNGKINWETTRGEMAWSMLLDLIHHRGQLSTYIRPMGGKVPAIYGSSGDSK